MGLTDPDLCRLIAIFVADVRFNLRLQRFEALPICDVEDGKASIGVPEVSLRDRFKPLLAGSVPDLHLYYLLIHFQRLYLEIHANRAQWITVEDIVSKPKQKRRLTDSRVTNEDNFVVCIDVFDGATLHLFAHTSSHALHSLFTRRYYV